MRRFLLMLVAVAAAGCSIRQQTVRPPTDTPAGLIDATAPPAAYLNPEQITTAAYQVIGPKGPPAGRPLNVLLVPGGGQYGAYAAGVLNGWTARGDRPDFDVVTGISSGALIAPLAFLGPKYDGRLAGEFTTVERTDLFKFQPVRRLARDKAVATAEPLERRLERVLPDAEFVPDLQAAHRAGRRLFLGTMDLHTRRLVVWDIGAIACGGRANAGAEIRKIMVAACSIPGLAPAVKFEVEVDGRRCVEEHADGGAVAQTFVRFAAGQLPPRPADPAVPWLGGSNLYIITCGKLYNDPLAGDPGFVTRVRSTVSNSLYALYRADLTRLHALCGATGMKFHLSSLPLDFDTPSSSLAFDNAAMRRMYAYGYDEAVGGMRWRADVPGVRPGEEEAPRSGRVFTTQPPSGPR